MFNRFSKFPFSSTFPKVSTFQNRGFDKFNKFNSTISYNSSVDNSLLLRNSKVKPKIGLIGSIGSAKLIKFNSSREGLNRFPGTIIIKRCFNGNIVGGKPQKGGSPLEEFGYDLTKSAMDGKLDPVIGRENEIRRTIQGKSPPPFFLKKKMNYCNFSCNSFITIFLLIIK